MLEKERLLTLMALALLSCVNASLDKRIRIEFVKVNITKAAENCSNDVTTVLGPKLSIWTRKAIAKYLNFDPNSTALSLNTDDDAPNRFLWSGGDSEEADGNNLYGWKVENDVINGVDLSRFLATETKRKVASVKTPTKAPVKAPVKAATKATSSSNSCSCSAKGTAISCAIYYCAQFVCSLCEDNRRRHLQSIYDDAYLPTDDNPTNNVDIVQLTLFVQNQIRWRSRRWLVRHRDSLHGCFGNFRKIRMFVFFD